MPELDPGDKTDPDVFGPRPEQESDMLDTVPRCVTCSRPLETPTSFEQGMIHAMNGVYFMLCQRLDRHMAASLTVWLKEGIIASQEGQKTYYTTFKD
jgi:hypothetical protein